ncbi:unnamed protein product [Schistosoma mattheei]|uniref:Uncharacterized protein n=1 Tax=Schistosoma mattheei TaxID=31246 RepID=A0A3P8G9S1_9TREM|nr:unnamed protein product [Schistosoma mattheei]
MIVSSGTDSKARFHITSGSSCSDVLSLSDGTACSSLVYGGQIPLRSRCKATRISRLLPTLSKRSITSGKLILGTKR